MVSGYKFLAIVIPKSWKYTILVEAHDKLGNQGNSCTYCLVNRQYYLKGMNKDIRKYIANCTHCHREKAKIQHYPLQMMEIPDRSFDKIAIDLIVECNTSTSGNKHFLGDPGSDMINLETHRLALDTAKKTLDENRFKMAQKTMERNPPSFKIGDCMYFRNKQPTKWDLKWRPGYRIVHIEHDRHF